MQRIERYGVIALVLLLVTIAAVSFWDDGNAESEKVAAETAGDRAGAQSENKANQNKRTAAKQEPGNGQLPNTAQRGLNEAAARTQAAIAEANRNAQLNRNNLARKSAQSEPNKKVSFETLPAKTLPPRTPPANAQQGGESLAQRGYDRDENGEQYNSGAEEEIGFPELPARGSDAERQAMANTMHASQTQNQKPKAQEPMQTSPKRNEQSYASGGATYVVQHGDTLSQIAYLQLGSSKRWPEIQALNGGLDPSAIHAGLELKLPVRSADPVSLNLETVARRSVSSFAPAAQDGKFYTVKKGDVLSQIAQDHLGSASRWKEIAELNPSINPNVLLEGKQLRMPTESDRVSAVTPTSKPSLIPVSKPSSKNRVR